MGKMCQGCGGRFSNAPISQWYPAENGQENQFKPSDLPGAAPSGQPAAVTAALERLFAPLLRVLIHFVVTFQCPAPWSSVSMSMRQPGISSCPIVN
jgi:hypothetical protein